MAARGRHAKAYERLRQMYVYASSGRIQSDHTVLGARDAGVLSLCRLDFATQPVLVQAGKMFGWA
jgi:hypothetical protein